MNHFQDCEAPQIGLSRGIFGGESKKRDGEIMASNPLLAPKTSFERRRLVFEGLFATFCFLSVASAFAILGILFYDIFSKGIEFLSYDFLTRFPSRFPNKSGIYSALVGSLWLLTIVLIVAVPLGVSAAVYLEEIMPNTKFRRFIDVNISNLASVPAIIYGILGLAIFVRGLGLDRSLISGGLTLSVLVLPVVVISTREALKNIPDSIRHAAYALGASRWQTLRDHVLPSAVPGIMTGIILALSRAIGESAPLLLVGAFSYVAFTPESIFDTFTALPIQIYNWVGKPQEEFHSLAASGIIVLLSCLLISNSFAIYIRNRSRRKSLCNKV